LAGHPPSPSTHPVFYLELAAALFHFQPDFSGFFLKNVEKMKNVKNELC